MKTWLLLSLMLVSIPGTIEAQTFDLRFDRLASALAALSAGDRKAVDESVELIRKGESNLALVRLSGLNQNNPENSSLRILTAYAMLRLGDLVGAFDQAMKGEKAPNGNAYKCWFAAKLAFLKGDNAACRRELDHAKTHGAPADDVKALENDLKNRKKRS